MNRHAVAADTVFDGRHLHPDCAVVIEGADIAALVPRRELPDRMPVRALPAGAWLAPGFIDVQVNGGGGVLFNDEPNAAGIAAIAAAHRRFGTTALLPTLISDSTEKMHAAAAAVAAARDADPGILGIHFEGPFLSPERPGVHDPALFRAPVPADFDLLAAAGRGVTVVTLAPERVPRGFVAALARAGVRIALGHSIASYAETRAAIAEGLTGFTHLFNAMPPPTAREPGPVAAALEEPRAFCGLIADGEHVAPAMLRLALRGCGRAMLVTDAMPPVGSARRCFSLFGKAVQVQGRRCVTADGTLAGSLLDMASAVRNCVRLLGLTLAEALPLASVAPAEFLGLGDRLGRLAAGSRADLVALEPAEVRVLATWVAGAEEAHAALPGWRKAFAHDGGGDRIRMEGLFGAYEEIRASGLFDPEYYLAAYPEIAEQNLDPLVHYLEEGAREGRNPRRDFDSAFYLKQCRQYGEQPENPLLHYLRIGAARGFKTGPEATPGRENADPVQRPPILVAIETIGVVGTEPGRTRLSIAGWALAAAPIAGIALSQGTEFDAAAFYGLPRPDIAQLHPERAGAARCGFVLAVDFANRGRSAIEPVLAVRTVDGAVARRPVPIRIPPQEVEVAAIDPLAGGIAVAIPDDRPPMHLKVEHAVVDAAGMLRLAGWLVARVQIERVEVSLDGMPLGAAAVGTVRPDIETAWPDYPNSRFSGFALTAAIGSFRAGRRRLVVRARGRAGVAREAAVELALPTPPTAAASAPDVSLRCHVEESSWAADGRLVVTGWAVGTAPLEAAAILLDDRETGRARIGGERPEIGNLFPTVPSSRFSGFAFAERVPRTPGEHRATLVLRCADGATCRQDLLLRDEAAPEMRGGSVRGDADRRLRIDAPVIVDGAVPAPVRGNLEIAGWAVARAGVAAVEIAIDGRRLARAELGQRRLDVHAAYPGWPGSAASGFNALLPCRILPKGRHGLTVTLRDATGRTVAAEFHIEVAERAATGPWSPRRQIPPAEAALGLRILGACANQPTFVGLLPVAGDEASIRRARRTISSLQAQVYPAWRLLLAAEAGDAAGLQALDERIAVVKPALPVIGEHEFLTVLTAGDELGADAFLELALAAATDAGVDFLYSDERRPDPASGSIEAFFKPDWSPDLLFATNYIGRLWCARSDLVQRIAGTEPLLGRGEYDLVLRCTEAAAAIRHLPVVLCERTEAPAAADAGALCRAMARRGIAGEVRAGLIPGSFRAKRRLVRPGPVSIIIPTCAAGGMIETCIGSLRRLTAYPDYEIVCIENIPPGNRKWRNWLRRHADRVIPAGEEFNWSRFNNRAAAEAKGDYLLFLNDDIEVTDPGWLDALLEEAQRPEVGAVGPRLLYPDGRVQHAGMFLAAPGQGRHAFRHAAAEDPGYFGLALTRRNVIAVTGACLLTRRETFEALGGFDEAHGIVNNDLDFCLRAWRSGLLNLYTPHATLIHHEAASRHNIPDAYDTASFDRNWRDLFFAGDPFFNPRLCRNRDDFAIEEEPTRLSVVGRPVFPREAIRNILALKLDHIGDCITAFPALRRLRQVFPQARIAVLTAPASRPVWALEPCVDATIDFEFFHPRSEFGEHELSDEAWDALRARLAPQRFDLAIDLRKHPETRPVLQHTGARFLAGFDFRSQFPWLDVALDWGGDQIYAPKHQHVAGDLVNLVDAVAAACEEARPIFAAARPAPGAELTALIAGIPGGGPLVCVHPAAGFAIKQWPAEGFAWVIDRLIADYDARVVLIGTPAEEATAEAVQRSISRPERVRSLIGRLPLAHLPGLLAQCALFLGNDSGPKHIAAGLGVPTVGVHGGTVDVREWGPVGPAALAVSREVTCSPCYLSRAEDCPRGVACLNDLEPARVYEACRRLLPLRWTASVSAPAEAG